jgi:hypothetical protein
MIGSAFECSLIEALIRVVLQKGDSLACSVNELAELTGGVVARAIRECVAARGSLDRSTREYQIIDGLLAHGSHHLAAAAAAGEVEIGGVNNRLEWIWLPCQAFSIKPLNFDFAGDGVHFANGRRFDAARVRFVADRDSTEKPALPAASSFQHGVPTSARRKTGPKFPDRDAVIERLLGSNLEPNVSWKEFATKVCDDADGWIDKKKTRVRVGYNIRAIKRVAAEIRKKKVTNSNSS